ncbi:Lipoprotein-releasing system ATP-binding protein LolD [uncultured Eubacteriales bacterium]|uniref:Lipoprotein-releasing system ATP-binding protein LolD n=1 Tax=uncultured Eubacteriales bacterium TaxID=172733 RepID=A0A212JDD4_9FIRM|nr:Lipoprotein-releasing system ATP-binding protein LolD [uncultured Eubacteriales bacterium]
MNMLKANGVSRTFRRGAGTVSAVQGITLELPSGQLTAIVGRSGSGKSTLLNLLAGLLTPTEGTVLLDGQELYRLPDAELSRLRSQKIGVIAQGQTALQNLTVLENIILPCALYPGVSDAAGRAQALLERVGISRLATARPASLSGGELRRMAVARALIRQPSVILADEPTSDLDGENTAAVIALLRQAADQGSAVLLVTHETDCLKSADEVYRMDGGMLSNI